MKYCDGQKGHGDWCPACKQVAAQIQELVVPNNAEYGEWIDSAERLLDAYRILDRHRPNKDFDNAEWCEQQWKQLWLLVQKTKASNY